MRFGKTFVYILAVISFEACHPVAGSATLLVNFLKFVNPHGLENTGSWCDGLLKRQCDHYFIICADVINSPPGTNPCEFSKKTLNPGISNNTLFFGSYIGEEPNPIEVQFLNWPGAIRIKVEVLDSDMSIDDRVDYFDYLLRSIPSRSPINTTYNKIEITGRWLPKTRLLFQYKLYCDLNYFGVDCSKYCLPYKDLIQGNFICEERTGERICQPGETCQTILDPCWKFPCLNGGTCIGLANDQYECLCPYGFNGTRCEIYWKICGQGNCYKLCLEDEEDCFEMIPKSSCEEDDEDCATGSPCDSEDEECLKNINSNSDMYNENLTEIDSIKLAAEIQNVSLYSQEDKEINISKIFKNLTAANIKLTVLPPLDISNKNNILGIQPVKTKETLLNNTFHEDHEINISKKFKNSNPSIKPVVLSSFGVINKSKILNIQSVKTKEKLLNNKFHHNLASRLIHNQIGHVSMKYPYSYNEYHEPYYLSTTITLNEQNVLDFKKISDIKTYEPVLHSSLEKQHDMHNSLTFISTSKIDISSISIASNMVQLINPTKSSQHLAYSENLSLQYVMTILPPDGILKIEKPNDINVIFETVKNTKKVLLENKLKKYDFSRLIELRERNTKIYLQPEINNVTTLNSRFVIMSTVSALDNLLNPLISPTKFQQPFNISSGQITYVDQSPQNNMKSITIKQSKIKNLKLPTSKFPNFNSFSQKFNETFSESKIRKTKIFASNILNHLILPTNTFKNNLNEMHITIIPKKNTKLDSKNSNTIAGKVLYRIYSDDQVITPSLAEIVDFNRLKNVEKFESSLILITKQNKSKMSTLHLNSIHLNSLTMDPYIQLTSTTNNMLDDIIQSNNIQERETHNLTTQLYSHSVIPTLWIPSKSESKRNHVTSNKLSSKVLYYEPAKNISLIMNAINHLKFSNLSDYIWFTNIASKAIHQNTKTTIRPSYEFDPNEQNNLIMDFFEISSSFNSKKSTSTTFRINSSSSMSRTEDNLNKMSPIYPEKSLDEDNEIKYVNDKMNKNQHVSVQIIKKASKENTFDDIKNTCKTCIKIYVANSKKMFKFFDLQKQFDCQNWNSFKTAVSINSSLDPPEDTFTLIVLGDLYEDAYQFLNDALLEIFSGYFKTSKSQVHLKTKYFCYLRSDGKHMIEISIHVTVNTSKLLGSDIQEIFNLTSDEKLKEKFEQALNAKSQIEINPIKGKESWASSHVLAMLLLVGSVVIFSLCLVIKFITTLKQRFVDTNSRGTNNSNPTTNVRDPNSVMLINMNPIERAAILAADGTNQNALLDSKHNYSKNENNKMPHNNVLISEEQKDQKF